VLELANYLKISDASDTTTTYLRTYLEIAESAVAAHMGATTLVAHDVSEVAVLPRVRPTIQLADGPVADTSNITKVQVSGYDEMDLDDIKLPHYWVIMRNDDFPANVNITVEYTAGWDEGDSVDDGDLPTGIRHAIILTAADFYQNPDKSIVSERIGDWAVTRSGARVSDIVSQLPERALMMLAPYVKPEF
jgi:hypothetical protein